MAGTLLVEVRKAVTDAIANLPEFADARVDMTWSAKVQVREQVFTTDAEFTHETAGLKAGRTFRNEDGTFTLVVLVQGVDQTMTWTSTRAVELGTVIEEWIADHRGDLGIAGLNWIVVSGDGALAELYADRSTIAELTYPIAYRARLT